MNIFVFPFHKDSPQFLSSNFFRTLRQFRKIKNSIIIFCFYNFNLYRKEVNALVIKDSKVIEIFGESFSNKQCIFSYKGIIISILLGLDIYTDKIHKLNEKSDIIFCIDNFEIEKPFDFTIKKFKGKSIFIDNKGFIYKRNRKFIKEDKKLYQFYVQKNL